MNNKNLKARGAVVLACLVIIVIVIYMPKPGPQRSKSPQNFVDPQYLKLATQAFSKALEANRIASEKSSQLLNGGKIGFSPLIAANTVAIDALAEADTSVEKSNEEFQRQNKNDTSLKALIEANVKLIASLNEVSETVKALNIEVEHLKKENTQSLSSYVSSIEKFTKAHKELTNAIEKGVNALKEGIKAYSAYYGLGNMINRIIR